MKATPIVICLAAALCVATVARSRAAASDPVLLVSGVQGASGSAIGPGGDLYVTEGATGSILRVDPDTGDVTTFASGLPPAVIPGLGGVVDVAFVGGTAYALVTLVDPGVGGASVDGIYRIDGLNSSTVIADIGAFSAANPPDTQFDNPTGLQYAIEAFRGGFLVTDGHLNRVLHVTHHGEISVMRAFDNIVPTGLAVSGNTIYMAEAGPTPHLPEDGKVVAFGPKGSVVEVAAGAPLLVDVEFGRGQTLYALAQGVFPGGPPASPALPNTGSLVRVNGDGTMTPIVEGLNLPTSVEFIRNSAFVVSLAGEIWRIDNVGAPPFGRGRGRR